MVARRVTLSRCSDSDIAGDGRRLGDDAKANDLNRRCIGAAYALPVWSISASWRADYRRLRCAIDDEESVSVGGKISEVKQ